MRNNFMILIFFQWKLRCCSFQIWHRADTRADTEQSILFWNFENFDFFSKSWCRSKPKFWKGCPPWCPPDVKFEKSNTSAFTEKKINVVTLFDDFLSPNEVWRPLRCVNSISKNLQNRLDSWFISKNQTFHFSEAKIV